MDSNKSGLGRQLAVSTLSFVLIASTVVGVGVAAIQPANAQTQNESCTTGVTLPNESDVRVTIEDETLCTDSKSGDGMNSTSNENTSSSTSISSSSSSTSVGNDTMQNGTAIDVATDSDGTTNTTTNNSSVVRVSVNDTVADDAAGELPNDTASDVGDEINEENDTNNVSSTSSFDTNTSAPGVSNESDSTLNEPDSANAVDDPNQTETIESSETDGSPTTSDDGRMINGSGAETGDSSMNTNAMLTETAGLSLSIIVALIALVAAAFFVVRRS